MKEKYFKYVFILGLLVISFMSCRDDVGDDIYTARGVTITQYLNDRPQTFSAFCDILERVNMKGLLDSYGHYTCFAPTNEAIQAYIAKSSYASIDEIPLDTLERMVKYQIIEGDTIKTTDMPIGLLPTSNMVGDIIICSVEEGVTSTYIMNGMSRIVTKDQRATNGIVHAVDAVIERDRENTGEKINNVDFDGRYSIFYEALIQTGLADSLTKYMDEHEFFYYKEKGGAKVTIPRYYKYTLFVESDETYNKAGIYSFQDLKDKYDDGKGAITSRTNGLNKFVSYHCLDRIYDEVAFSNYSKQDGYEIVETMCKNTLLEISTVSGRVHFNRFVQDGTVVYDGSALVSETKYKNILTNNGMVHEVTEILAIPDQTRYFNKKMRFNVASFLPELMNGNFRGNIRREFPRVYTDSPQYFDNLKIIGEAGYVIPVYDYTPTWIRHQFDEILIGMGYVENDQCSDLTAYANTRYDVSLTMPPIPPGRWEIRFGFTSNQYRGMAQLFFDGAPSGVPLNLGPGEDYGIAGMDEETARKVMYNNSFMPFPSHIKNGSGGGTTYLTTDRLRRIIGIYNFSTMEKHVLRFKTVEPGQLSLNFVEWIPVDQIESEGTD